MKMENHILNINTILHTKDGSKIGNAIVTGRDGYYWEITTDYGNKVKLTSEEIDECFNIAWSNVSKEIDGFSCQEIQEMMSDTHKHRVPSFEIMEENKTVRLSMEEILRDAVRRQATYQVQFADYDLHTWTAPCQLTENRMEKLLDDGSIRKVRLELEM